MGLAANSPLILGEGWFCFLFYSGQDCSVASGCFSLVDSRTQIKSYRNSKNAVDITHQKNRDCVDQLLAYLFKSHNHLFRDQLYMYKSYWIGDRRMQLYAVCYIAYCSFVALV